MLNNVTPSTASWQGSIELFRSTRSKGHRWFDGRDWAHLHRGFIRVRSMFWWFHILKKKVRFTAGHKSKWTKNWLHLHVVYELNKSCANVSYFWCTSIALCIWENETTISAFQSMQFVFQMPMLFIIGETEFPFLPYHSVIFRRFFRLIPK